MAEVTHIPMVLVILDGWGIAPDWGGNAISLAKTPTIHELTRSMPHTELAAAAEAVGLPAGIMGNSEVGHLNIGAGKIVKQFLPLIDEAIRSRTFFQNPALLKAMQTAKAGNKTVHLMGIFSDGSVHGHIRHLYALLEMAKEVGVDNVVIDAFTDGRDTETTGALGYYEKTSKFITSIHSPARFGTVIGRFYAMDRDNRKERTEATYNALVYGKGAVYKSAGEAISAAYKEGKIDEFIDPCIIQEASGQDNTIKDGDVVICFNFRSDRMRQIVKALCGKDSAIDRGKNPPNLAITTFTEYEADLPVEVAFHPDPVQKSLSQVVSDAGLQQFHVAETEKYAHVTYFFNGGIESPEPGETRLLVPSPKVATYDKAPEMSAAGITKALLEKLEDKRMQFYVVNFANADMVGHTGNIRATIAAVETIDRQLRQIWEEVKKQHGTLIITADHGNAEQKIDPETGLPDTEHTKNPVPFILCTDDPALQKVTLVKTGFLGNIAPTILDIMGLAKPDSMTLDSLIQH